METKVFFQFEFILNVLVSSLRFIWIPMLWVKNQHGDRQKPTSTEVQILKTVPALKRVNIFYVQLD